MDYSSIIAVAAFFVAVQLATRTAIRPLLSASIAVFIPYVVKLVVGFINATSYNLPILPNLFSVASVVTVVLQFSLAVYIFKRIQDEDSIASVLAWGVGGFLIIIVGIPAVVGLLMSR